MKKFIFAILLMTSLANVNAEEYGPSEGELSLGVTLNPIAEYLGNLFNGSTNNSLGSLNGEGMINQTASIMGKLMITDEWAVRANVGFVLKRENDKQYSRDDEEYKNDPSSDKMVIDVCHMRKKGGSFSLGLERRLSNRRIQPIVGFGMVYAFESERHTYDYGNAIKEKNQRPSSSMGSWTYAPDMPYARVIEDKISAGKYHSVGIYGLTGIEFFLTKQVSLGAEMNISAVWRFSPETSTKYEGYNTKKNRVDNYTERTNPGSSEFTFSTDNLGANLVMNFYF